MASERDPGEVGAVSSETSSEAERALELLGGARDTLAAGRLSAARTQFLAVAEAAERARLPELRAEAALGAGGLWLHELRMVDERAAFLALMRDAIARLGDDRPDLQRRLRARLAAEAVYDGTGPIDELRAVLAEAREVGDLRALAEGLSVLHHTLMPPQYAHDRLAIADEMLTVASSLGDRNLVLMGMCWRTVDLFLLGHSEAERSLADLRVRADQYDVIAVRFVVAAIDTMLLIRAGRFADAEAMALACHGLGTETGDADADAWYLSQVFSVRWMQGRAAELVDALEEIERSTTIVHNYAEYVWAIAAVLWAEARNRDRARAALDRVFASTLDALPESSAWLPVLFCLAEAAQYLDDPEAASEVVEALVPFASLPMMGSLAVLCFGSASRSVGLARRTMGELDGAIVAFDSAILQNRRLGHLPMLAISRADLAATLVMRSRGADANRARELYDAAITAANGMDMQARVEVWRSELATMTEPPRLEATCNRRRGRWEITAGSERAVVADSIGMTYLAALLARPNEDIRAAELAGAVEEDGSQPVLDDRARAAYRRRIGDLRREIDEADADANIERAAALRSELDALMEELMRVVRPGGRSRTFAGGDERARTSVQKALRRAIASVAVEAPHLADGLTQAIRTGTACRFAPVEGVPERWRVEIDNEPSE
jgi:hypothetical protein